MEKLDRTEDSLGGRSPGDPERQDMFGRAHWLTPSDMQSQGAVYTPKVLAAYVAAKLLSYTSVSQAVVLDPACGDGALLEALALQCGVRGVRSTLVGVDLDGEAIGAVKNRLSGHPSLFLRQMDALDPHTKGTKGSLKDWLLSEVGGDLPSLLIANPPWGGQLSENLHRQVRSTFQLAHGQFDTSDLFVELATRVVKRSGYAALIVPDSFFALERKSLRKLLLTKTQLKFVARLGEGFFKGVYRGCAVIIFRNSEPEPNQLTRCFRLNPKWRTKVLSGASSLEEAEQSLAHDVLSSRFTSTADYLIDIDSGKRDVDVLIRLGSTESRVGDYLEGSRGVELSKRGAVVGCSVCDSWSPRPKNVSRCPSCGQMRVRLTEDCLVSCDPRSGAMPLIVGEDIDRHAVRPSRWIVTGRAGISYKDEALYRGPKLLVRKTGIGILAAMDYSGALTNQVTYVFRRREDLPGWIPTEFFAALLCSRAAFYFIAKRRGETEWRSHPYLTQRDVLNVPSPCLSRLSRMWVQVAETEAILRTGPNPYGVTRNEDARLERIVADCLQLSRRDYEVIFEALNAMQDLRPVRALKHLTIDDIF